MDIAQSPIAYPIGPCTDDWLLANLNTSLYLDAFLDAFKVSLVTLPFCLFFGFSCVFLLRLNVVLLGFSPFFGHSSTWLISCLQKNTYTQVNIKKLKPSAKN